MNTRLVKDRVWFIARQYHCLGQNKFGGLSNYAKETLSELERVEKPALIECIPAGSYDTEKGWLTTYVTPFLEGAMRRHLECSMGTLALDRDSMRLVRKTQRLYYQEGKELCDICAVLGIPSRAAGVKPSVRLCGRCRDLHTDYGMSAGGRHEKPDEGGRCGKARDQAPKHLQERCMGSFAWKLRRARQMITRLTPRNQIVF